MSAAKAAKPAKKDSRPLNGAGKGSRQPTSLPLGPSSKGAEGSAAKSPAAKSPAAKSPATKALATKAVSGAAKRPASRAPGKIPSEIPTLSRWIADDPKPRLEEVKNLLLKAGKERFTKLLDPVRIAIAWAWDENPDVFYKLLGPWHSHESPRLRIVAAGALPLANEACHERSSKILKKMALDPDRDVRNHAIDILAEEVDGNFELVKRWAVDQDPAVREIVARHLHLTDTPKKVLPLLEQLALDADPDVHWCSARALYDLHEREAKGALEVAKKMAASAVLDIRRAVAYSYFEHVFGDSFDHSFLLMRQWVRSGDANLRWTLAHSLRWAKPNARALQVLRALFEDRDPEIRVRVVTQLRDFFPRFEDARPAAELLRRAQKDQAKKVRDTAAEAESALGIDLTAIPLPPLEGEPGAEAQEPAWSMPIDDDTAEPVEAEGEKDDDEDDDF